MLWAAYCTQKYCIDRGGLGTPNRCSSIPVGWPRCGAEDAGGIVAADLGNSGKFNPLDRSRLPQQPGSAQKFSLPRGLHWALMPWLWVRLPPTRTALTTWPGSWWIPVVHRVPFCLQNSYKVTFQQYLRYAAHAASDAVFEKLTGKGAFRTRIAYVVQTNGGSSRMSCASLTTTVTTSSGETLFSATDVSARSPDGFQLAYVTFSGRSALVIQTLANGAVRQVASFPRHNGAFVLAGRLCWPLRCPKPVA